MKAIQFIFCAAACILAGSALGLVAHVVVNVSDVCADCMVEEQFHLKRKSGQSDEVIASYHWPSCATLDTHLREQWVHGVFRAWMADESMEFCFEMERVE